MTNFASSEEMDAVWTEADSKASRSIRKIETHQVYASDEGLAAYLRKDRSSVVAGANKMFEGDLAFYTNLLRKRILFTRLRIVEKPYTEYTKFEFVTYKIGARYGERIGILNKTDVPASLSESVPRLGDFVVYDEFLAIFNHFDKDGNFLGNTFSRDSDRINQCIALFDSLLANSHPLGHFESEEGDHLGGFPA